MQLPDLRFTHLPADPSKPDRTAANQLLERVVCATDYFPQGFTIPFEDRALPVNEIEFKGSLQLIRPDLPLVEAAEYSSTVQTGDSKETFVRLGRWKGPENQPIKEMMIIGFLRDPSNPQ